MPDTSVFANPELIDKIVAVAISLISALITLVSTHLLKNSGKILIYLRSIEDDFRIPDDMGGQESVVSIQEADYALIRFDIDFWNSADSPKSIRDLKIVITNNKKRIELPLNVSERINHNSVIYPLGSSYTKEYSVINLPSKQISPLCFYVRIPNEYFSLFHGTVKFRLKGKHPNCASFNRNITSREYLA